LTNLYDVIQFPEQPAATPPPEPTPAEIEQARKELIAKVGRIKRAIEKKRYVDDPVYWLNNKLKESLWSKQREILESVRDHRNTAVKSCHEVGKSWIASRVVAWWLDRYPAGEAFVVTSAPTANQVKNILWREIGRAHTAGDLNGRITQTAWYMDVKGDKEEVVAFGRKPADYDATAFQGIHAIYVLVVLDEACGIPELLYEAARSLTANDNSKTLAIGNPDDPTSHFEVICRPGSGFNVVTISAFDSPNFTGEPMPKRVLDQLIGPMYVEESRAKWARNWVWNEERTRVICPEGHNEYDTHPFWQSKVLGRFPLRSTVKSLIPQEWIRRAQEASLSEDGPNELGCDVGAGGDESTICHRRGQRYRVVFASQDPDTMRTCGEVVRVGRELAVTRVKVDKIGIGLGITNRGAELHTAGEIDFEFIGVNVGSASFDDEELKAEGETFVNLRAQNWWFVRTLFEKGAIDIDPHDDDLAAELADIRFFRTSNGRIQIESKKDAMKRHVASPNRADSLMLAAAPPPTDDAAEGGLVW
jgi:hypothetical protein